MRVPSTYIRGLIGIEQEPLLVVNDQCHTTDHNPVLTAMVMHLERQRALRFYDNALDLEASALFQGSVSPPGTLHRSVVQVRAMTVFLQLRSDYLDVLGMVFVRDQQSIRRIDNDQVLSLIHI